MKTNGAISGNGTATKRALSFAEILHFNEIRTGVVPGSNRNRTRPVRSDAACDLGDVDATFSPLDQDRVALPMPGRAPLRRRAMCPRRNLIPH